MEPNPGSLYCPNCAVEVNDPLTCGDCSSIICRRCGTPLESSDELGIGWRSWYRPPTPGQQDILLSEGEADLLQAL